MKVHLLSDLHNEFDYFQPGDAAQKADVVVLAGDIDLGYQGRRVGRQEICRTGFIYSWES